VIRFTAARGVDQAAFAERKQWAAETLDYLQREFGLAPDDFEVEEVIVRPPDQIGAIGDYLPDDQVIEVSSGLLPGVGTVYRGEHKVAGGHWKNVFRHELGHAWQYPFEAAAKRIDPKFDLIGAFREAKPTARRDLTFYSGHNHFEYFAESFSAFTHPRFAESEVKIQPDLLALFRRIIPRQEED
jgi:hypothetical protein